MSSLNHKNQSFDWWLYTYNQEGMAKSRTIFIAVTNAGQYLRESMGKTCFSLTKKKGTFSKGQDLPPPLLEPHIPPFTGSILSINMEK